MFKKYFFSKTPCVVKRSAMGRAMGISPSKGGAMGSCYGAVGRSIDRTPLLCYGPTAGGRADGCV